MKIIESKNNKQNKSTKTFNNKNNVDTNIITEEASNEFTDNLIGKYLKKFRDEGNVGAQVVVGGTSPNEIISKINSLGKSNGVASTNAVYKYINDAYIINERRATTLSTRENRYSTDKVNNTNVVPKDIYEKSFVTPAFISAPGVGKTTGVKEWIEKHPGVKLLSQQLEGCDATLLKGYPIPDYEKKTVTFYASDFLLDLLEYNKKGPFILFFDEFNRAPYKARISAGELMLYHEIPMINGIEDNFFDRKSTAGAEFLGIEQEDIKAELKGKVTQQAEQKKQGEKPTPGSDIDVSRATTFNSLEEFKKAFKIINGYIYLNNLVMVVVAMNSNNEPEVVNDQNELKSYEISRLSIENINADIKDSIDYIISSIRTDIASALVSKRDSSYKFRELQIGIKTLALAYYLLSPDRNGEYKFAYSTFDEYEKRAKESSESAYSEGVKEITSFQPRDLTKLILRCNGDKDRFLQLLEKAYPDASSDGGAKTAKNKITSALKNYKNPRFYGSAGHAVTTKDEMKIELGEFEKDLEELKKSIGGNWIGYEEPVEFKQFANAPESELKKENEVSEDNEENKLSGETPNM